MRVRILNNETSKQIIEQYNQLNLMGIFDISDTVAISISYQLTLTDPDDDALDKDDDDDEEPAIAPIIIFVIVICSLFGFLVIVLGVIFLFKRLSNRKSLIRLDNEIQFKGKNIS